MRGWGSTTLVRDMCPSRVHSCLQDYAMEKDANCQSVASSFELTDWDLAIALQNVTVPSEFCLALPPIHDQWSTSSMFPALISEQNSNNGTLSSTLLQESWRTGSPRPRHEATATVRTASLKSFDESRVQLKVKPPTFVRQHRKVLPTRQRKRSVLSAHLVPDQFDHVVRERQRRDTMNSKLLALGALLPAGIKRDRVSIVSETIRIVQVLQQKVYALQNRSSDLKSRLQRSALPESCEYFRGCKRVDQHQLERYLVVKPPSSKTAVCTPGQTYSIPRSKGSNAKPLEEPLSIEFHVQLENSGQQMEISKGRCQIGYLSKAMQTLELLNLDLCRCSVTKLYNSVICVILAKARTATNLNIITPAQLAVSLKAAIEA